MSARAAIFMAILRFPARVLVVQCQGPLPLTMSSRPKRPQWHRAGTRSAAGADAAFHGRSLARAGPL